MEKTEFEQLKRFREVSEQYLSEGLYIGWIEGKHGHECPQTKVNGIMLRQAFEFVMTGKPMTCYFQSFGNGKKSDKGDA